MPRGESWNRPLLHNHLACRHLTTLTSEHLPQDGSIGRTRAFRQGANIWRPKDRADRMYFLLRGRVELTVGSTGHETTLWTVHPGQPFGELCFCSEERRNTGRSIVASRALEIRYDEFLDYVHERPDVLQALVFTLCDRLGNADMRIDALAHRQAQERLGTLLLHMAVSEGRQAESGMAVLHVSHEELAHLSAMTRSHVTSTMVSFRQRGLVQYARGKPLRVNVAALRAYLEHRAKTAH